LTSEEEKEEKEEKENLIEKLKRKLNRNSPSERGSGSSGGVRG